MKSKIRMRLRMTYPRDKGTGRLRCPLSSTQRRYVIGMAEWHLGLRRRPPVRPEGMSAITAGLLEDLAYWIAHGGDVPPRLYL